MSEPDAVAATTTAAVTALGWVTSSPITTAVVAARSPDSFVLALVDPRTGRVGAFAKSAAAPATDLEAEARALGRARAAAPTGTVPEVVAILDAGGRSILVQRALPGTTFLALLRTRRISRRHCQRVVESAAGWLRAYRNATVDSGTGSSLCTAAWWEQVGGGSQLADELVRLEAHTPTSWRSHGDFWAGNLLVHEGSVGVVDWQHAHGGDRVLSDFWWLLFTTAHAMPRLGGGWRSAADAFSAAFLAPGRLADAWTPLVRRQLTDAAIPVDLGPAALLVSLQRYESLFGERESLGPASADWRELAAALATAAPGSMLRRLREDKTDS